MAKRDRLVACRFFLAILIVSIGALALGLRRGGRTGMTDGEAADMGRAMARPVAAVSWRGATLPRAIDDLERLAGVRIAVRWDALKAAHAALDDPAIEAELHGVSCAAAMGAALGQVEADEPLECVFRDGALTVSTGSDLARHVVVRAYDAGDLVDQRYWPCALAAWDRYFKDREIRVLTAPPPPGVCFFGPLPVPSRTITEEANSRLRDLASVVSDSGWRGGAAGFDGRLVVRAPEDVQRAVHQLLRELRSAGGEGPERVWFSASQTPAHRVAAEDAARADATPLTQPTSLPAVGDPPTGRVIAELDLRGATLEQAFDRLRDLTKANIVVHWRSLATAGVKPDDVVKVRLWDVTLGRALAVLLAVASDDPDAIGFAEEFGVITVSTPDRLNGHRPMRLYDVRDLLVAMRQDHDALYGPQPNGDLSMSIDEYADELATYLRDTIDPDSWRDNGGAVGSLRHWSGRLWIEQTTANHGRIDQALEQMRAEFAKPLGRPATQPAGATSKPALKEGK